MFASSFSRELMSSGGGASLSLPLPSRALSLSLSGRIRVQYRVCPLGGVEERRKGTQNPLKTCTLKRGALPLVGEMNASSWQKKKKKRQEMCKYTICWLKCCREDETCCVFLIALVAPAPLWWHSVSFSFIVIFYVCGKCRDNL